MKYKHLKILNLVSIFFGVGAILYFYFQLNELKQMKNDLELDIERRINNLDSTAVLYIDTLIQE